jgi:hypothetical protein
MKMHLLTPVLLLAGLTAPAADTDTAAAYSRLKSLVGEWEGSTDQGKARLSYELIAGGTSLVEKETAENMPAMMTVYHVDGPRLMLTHYCMAGNQPRMEAARFNRATGELEFRFLDSTNLPNPNAGHMHNAKIRFVDNDHIETVWQFYEGGKVKMAETTRYTRVHNN